MAAPGAANSPGAKRLDGRDMGEETGAGHTLQHTLQRPSFSIALSEVPGSCQKSK